MGISLAAVGAAVATAYPILTQIMQTARAPRIAELRKQLNQILAKYNLQISDIQRQMEARGIKYNNLMDKLSGTSPSGTAGKYARSATYDYNRDNQKDIKTINDLSHRSAQYSAQREADISKQENKGLIKTILGGF